MNTKDYLTKVAYITEIDVMNNGDLTAAYHSKFDDSYITFVGLEDGLKYFAEHEITDELTHGVGFSPKENKWYGWSHRAIYGFQIGSTCKKGDCHYRAANIEDEIEAAILFWSDNGRFDVKAKHLPDTQVITVSWLNDVTEANKKLVGNVIAGGNVDCHYEIPFGHGEWTAKTLEDAKQMAIDFNKGVS